MTVAETEHNQPGQEGGSSVNYQAMLDATQGATQTGEPDSGENEHAKLDGASEPPARQRQSLEGLRHGLRGSDEAVREIGAEPEQAQLLEVLKDPTHHSRDELREAVASNYSGDAYGDYQWGKKISAWGDTPERTTLYGELAEGWPQFAQLGLDPGFMTHLPEFMDMLKAGEITSTDYAGAREELKAKLGHKTLYRGTMLTDEELRSVRETGMMSPLSKHVEASEQPKEQFEATALSAGISNAVEAHFHGEHGLTPFLSVSEHEDVAIAVGRHFAKRGEGKKFYLFELSVPAIDVTSYTEHAVKTPYKLQAMKDRNPDISLKVSVNEQEARHKWDEKVESYIFGKIDPDEIVEISQPEITESTWNSRKTT